MNPKDFSQNELAEISDAIGEVFRRLLASGDPEQHEKKYGTLTSLREAHAKILPVVFGFQIGEAAWAAEQAERIIEIRKSQGLTECPTDAERAKWAATLRAR